HRSAWERPKVFTGSRAHRSTAWWPSSARSTVVRPRFYERAAQVLKPGGLVVLADIAFADGAAFLTRRAEDLRRVGTQSSNRTAWERHFRTRSVRRINEHTQPGAQMTVWQILKTAPSS